MDTKIIKIDENHIDENLIEEAARIIEGGGLVSFPTETVYGLGADGLNEEAVKKIFEAKGRPQDNPLILHVHSIDQVEELAEEIPPIARLCMDKFWHGPITFLFKRSSLVPDIITAGLDTVAIRMPENKIALDLIKKSKRPIAAPSANISGRPSPTSAKHVIEDLSGKIDMIIDGGSTGIGLESTVLDLSLDPPMILRPGGITEKDLEKILPNIVFDSSIIKEEEGKIPRSPGQKYRHYAPKAEMMIFSGDMGDVVHAIASRTKEYINEGKTVGIICTDESKDSYKEGILISMGSRDSEETIARNLFGILREFNDLEVDVILAEAIEMSNLGIAIMNRMMKAASGKIIRV